MTKKQFRDELVNFGFSDEEYKIVRHSIQVSNYKNMKILGGIGTTFLGILALITFLMMDNQSWIAYVFSFLISLCACILNLTVVKKNLELLRIPIYLVCIAFFGIGTLIGTLFQNDLPGISFICYLIILPIVFTDRPYKLILSESIVATLYFVCCGLFHKTAYLQIDILNILSFGFIAGVIAVYFGKVRITSFLRAYQIDLLAHRDELTGALNRNSYEERIGSYPSQIKKTIACLYFDVNGLHEVNNSKGHEAGDIMLKAIASIIVDVIGKENSFRTGGDEFVGFLLDENEESITLKAKDIEKKIHDSGYCVALGIKTSKKESLDMHNLITEAELLMYQDKENFYVSHGEHGRSFFRKLKEDR